MGPGPPALRKSTGVLVNGLVTEPLPEPAFPAQLTGQLPSCVKLLLIYLQYPFFIDMEIKLTINETV